MSAQQGNRNTMALLSLAVALCALFYNTWRNESTEGNRNIRAAEFEMLKSLSELQQVVEYAAYRKDKERGDLTRALTLVLQIRDLGELTTPAVNAASMHLQEVWAKQGDQIGSNLEVSNTLSEEILNTRRVVITSLRELH